MEFTIKILTSKLFLVVKYLILVLFILFSLFPIVWLVVTSFKPESDFFSFPPTFSFQPTLENYRRAIFNSPTFFPSLAHSFVLAMSVTFLSVLVGSTSGYALARFRFKGAKTLGVLILLSRLVPGAVMVIPYFALLRVIGLTGSMIGLIVTYTSFALGFCSWMMYGFFLELPRELEEAALIDGASYYGAFWRIAFPLAMPGITATGILVFISSWNEFLYALIIGGANTRTLPVELASNITDRSINWGNLFAIATCMVVPIFILAISVQRNLVRGLTAGAVKG